MIFNSGKIRGNIIFSLLLTLALLMCGWVIYKLIKFHEYNYTSIIYNDSIPLEISNENFRCATNTHKTKFEINDYSYNVLSEASYDSTYRYKSRLEATPPVNVHILTLQGGGSGRVVVEKSEKPIWLLLLSNGPSIWHVESYPGSNIEKIIINEQVNEIRLTETIEDRLSAIFDLITRQSKIDIEKPAITLLPINSCLKPISRFQKFNERARFKKFIGNLRSITNYPELSFQSNSRPSYFMKPYKVPFPNFNISSVKLAEIEKLALPSTSNKAQSLKQKATESTYAQYANMQRRDDINEKTFSSVSDFIKTLHKYQSKNLLPSLMPRSNVGGGNSTASWYNPNDYKKAYTKKVLAGETKITCNDPFSEKLLIVEGTNEVNKVSCARGNQLYFMGDGNDEIDDAWDDDIIYAGLGNDTIDAHWGNDIIFFNYGWGQDKINKTCTFSAYVPQDTINAYKANWSKNWTYKNFIVFGENIKKDDIVFIGNKLINKNTGDSIEIKGSCFNYVFWR